MTFRPATEPAKPADPAGNVPQVFTGSTVARHACAACHQLFPENIMVCISQRWLCALCKERALADDKGPRREYSMRTWAPDVEKWKVIVTLIAVFGGLAFRVFLWDHTPRSRSAPEDNLKPWVTKALEERDANITKMDVTGSKAHRDAHNPSAAPKPEKKAPEKIEKSDVLKKG